MILERELELYIHIPFCRKKCLYCDFLSFTGCHEDDIHDYVRALQGEIRQKAPEASGRKITSIFIGGGTPGSINPDYIGDIMDTIRYFYDVDENAEITVEVNPGIFMKEGFRIYKASGINRVSVGLQSADDSELHTLGRIHDYSGFLRTYESALKAGYDNINIDIMTAIPGQTLQSLEKTLSQVTKLRPAHISAYSLMIEEGTPFYEKYGEDDRRRKEGLESGHLPSEETVCAMDVLTNEYLGAHGYNRYEISNYTKKGKECRHNIGYWTGKDYLGFGIGSASLFNGIRSTNTKDMAKYIKLISKAEDPAEESFELSRKDRMEEFMFLGLRMIEGVSRRDFEGRFNAPIEAIYGDVINRLAASGMILPSSGMIRLTEDGINLSNIVLAEFLL